MTVSQSPDERTHYVLTLLAALDRRGASAVLRRTSGPVSGRDFSGWIRRTAEGLRRCGVTTGTIVAVLTEANAATTLVARYAAHLLGATVVHVRSPHPGQLDVQSPVAAQAGILAETGAALLVVDPACAERGADIAARAGHPVTLAGLGDCDGTAVDVTTAEPADDARGYAVPPGSALLVYTSGSTGRPKGVRKPFGAWNRAVTATAAAASPSTFLVVTPLSNSVALMVDVTLAAGGTIVLHESFDAGAALRAIASDRVTGTFLAVAQLYALLDHPDVAHTDLSSLRRVVYGGAPAVPARLAEAVTRFGGALSQSYGSTESGRITQLGPTDHGRPELLDSVGRAFPEVTLRIAEPGTSRELPAGHTGEVLVRSPGMMTGYLADPARTAAALADGWLHTGDLGHLDESGYLRLAGRIDDVIKCRDTKVHPAAVEQVLTAFPGIADAAVYGVPGADGLEQVHAAVVLRPAVTCPAGVLREHVRTALTPMHVPARLVRHDEVPRTESGKADRQRLRWLDASAPALPE
jgi:acyl-CoA synthetase (AMP-forming)/AMP-acid ligase II